MFCAFKRYGKLIDLVNRYDMIVVVREILLMKHYENFVWKSIINDTIFYKLKRSQSIDCSNFLVKQ
jgi:hypothetical protein